MADRTEYMRAYRERQKQISSVTKHGVKHLWNKGKLIKNSLGGFVLILFISANTWFLVHEQMRFYIAHGWSEYYSFFVSILAEVAIIFLSVGWGMSSERKDKLNFFVLLILTVLCVLGVIVLGIQKEGADSDRKLEIEEILRKDLKMLKEQEDSPKVIAKIAKKETELLRTLQANTSKNVPHETFFLTILRVISMLWNVLFCSYLPKLLIFNRAR
jgi:uncharacterized membrane protein